MSLFQALSNLTGQTSANAGEQPTPDQHASIAQAFIQHAGQQPGGLSGVLDQFRQNGMGQHVDSWLATQPGSSPAQPVQPQQIEQGLGTGQLQSIAQHAGISPGLAKIALATALPLLMSHLSQGSGQLPTQSSSGPGLAGLAQGFLSRII